MEKENNTKAKAAAAPKKKKSRSWEIEKMILKKIAWLAAIVLILTWVDMNMRFTSAFRSEREARAKWQAVFLNNGQVYFGHLTRNGFDSWKLSDAYYIQVTKVPVVPQAEPEKKNSDKTEAPQPIQEETRNTIVKMTGDLHSPENTMTIPSSNILFWQNLSKDSNIVQTINSQPAK